MSAVIQSLANQYGAGLSMLRSCVERADGDVWHAVVGKFPYWRITYHVLHATDFYLSPDEATFRPQPFHREGYELLGAPFWAPDQEVIVDQPYDRGTLAGYVDTCRAKTKLTLRGETEAKLGGPSGFSWLEFCRLECICTTYVTSNITRASSSLPFGVTSTRVSNGPSPKPSDT